MKLTKEFHGDVTSWNTPLKDFIISLFFQCIKNNIDGQKVILRVIKTDFRYPVSYEMFGCYVYLFINYTFNKNNE